MSRYWSIARITWFAVVSIILVTSLVAPVHLVLAAGSGGYPWADATPLNLHTYDWGYTTCQPTMQETGACNWHNTYKQGKLYYESDPWRYDVRNCTSYVAWRINHEFGINLVGWGDARNWDDAALRAGYSVDSKATVGDVAVWEGYYGHVAYVSSVNPDGTVNVEQYNRAGTGEFSKESRVRAAHYVHISPPKDEQAPVALSTIVETKTTEMVALPSVPATQPPPGERSTNTSLVPLPALTPTDSPLASTADSDFLVAITPTDDQVRVYAVQHGHTESGRLEVSESNKADGNSTWQHTWATAQLAIGSGEADYTLADANSDGQLDLYQIKHSLSTSGRTEVSILDGSTNFATFIGSWATSETTMPAGQANYGVGDYDGDGALDLYKITKPTATTGMSVKVLNGAKGFDSPLGSWEADRSANTLTSYYELGDHDHDGKIDIYQLSPQSDRDSDVQVKVFDAGSNYQNIFKTWILPKSI